MKKTILPAIGERDNESEFSHFFPSRPLKDFDRNSPEASVLRVFSCLPSEYVSPKLFSRLLGQDFPLNETLRKLTEKGMIRKNEKDESFALCSESIMESSGEDLSSSREGLALISLISAEMEKAKKQENFTSLKNWLELGRSVIRKFDEPGIRGDGEGVPYNKNLSPEAAASIFNSSILFCNVIIEGKEIAAGLKYDEENMFAPMIIFLEKKEAAASLVWAAKKLSVPVVKNDFLAKNLFSYGKAGASVPESCYRDVSMALARSDMSNGSSSGTYRTGRVQARELTPPLSIELGEALYELSAEKPGRKILISDPMEAIREKLEGLLGMKIGKISIRKNSEIRKDSYRILLKGREAGRGNLEMGWYYPENEKTGVPDFMKTDNSISIIAGTVFSSIAAHANLIVQRRAHELLGRDEVEAILEEAENKYPVVCSEVKGFLPLGIIREIFQSLVSEMVPLKYIDTILEVLADWSSFGPAPYEMIVEQVRLALKRQICMDYADDDLNLRVLTLETDLEKMLLDASPADSGDSPSSPDSWMDDLAIGIEAMEKTKSHPVLLCHPRLRFHLKEITRKRFPYLAVISYIEISPEVTVMALDEIKLRGN